ncbi:MAG: hypothetical protein RKH07_01370 [Gammaproteobacteria bacterium]
MIAPEDEQTLSSSQRPEPDSDTMSAELLAARDWLKDLTEAGSLLSRLAIAEVRLALSDFRRSLVLGLVAIQVMLLAWAGFCAFIAWSIYLASGYTIIGIATFLLLQVIMLVVIRLLQKRLHKSMRLPETRRQLQSILEDFGYGQGSTGS